MSPERNLLSIRRLAGLLTASLVILGTIAGCGGGTTGTGGTGSSQFAGRIVYSTGEPVANATVVLQETGDTATSDAEGNFVIESDLTTPTATLLIETTEIQTQTTITDIPAGPQEVTVQLSVDKSTQEVNVSAKEVKPRRRRPKPTAVPTALPSPDPTLAPVEPTVAPGPTELPSDEETPSPEPTLEATATVNPLQPGIPATVEPTATPLSETVVRGIIVGDADIVSNLRVDVNGGQKKRVRDTGAFLIRTTLQADLPVLGISLGKRSTSIVLEGVTTAADRVILEISVSAGPNLTLVATLNSIRIVN